jgi:hypothetical protein
MWLRIGRQGRWTGKSPHDPGHVAEAARDLALRPDEEGLTIFRALDAGEAMHLARVFALTCRDRPANLDYVLIPEDCLSDVRLSVVKKPDPNLHPYLSERHYEIVGTDVETSRALAARIIAHAEHQVRRLKEGEIKQLAAGLVEEDPKLQHFLREGWRHILGLGSGS